ncbi:unnamed protein product [Ilex paraguariensis]|uniref:G-patch domain-containing protein n=1 Tax=Ilex paraguariensis TaxID=185542 RepID=A0ABC8ST03_9AQUA
MKLSFSLSSNPSSLPQHLKRSQTLNNPKDQEDLTTTSKQYITEFDSLETLKILESKKLIIPPKANEWRPCKKTKYLDLPAQSSGPDNLQFELDPTSSIDLTDSSISYGLNLRQSINNDAVAEPQRPEPIESVMLQKLKDDLQRLPEDKGFDEFTDMPVEGFGKALLSGYGWYEGRGIGRNAKEDVKVVEYTRRTAKEGLGFVGEVPQRDNKNTKQEREQRGNIGKEKDKSGFYVGQDVRVVGGKNMGQKGRILGVMGGGDSIILKLSRNEEEVMVRFRDLADLGSVDEQKCSRKLGEWKMRELTDQRGKDKESSSGRGHKEKEDDWSKGRKKESKRSRDGRNRGNCEEEVSARNPVSWLTSHIRVRIISKELKGGRLYLKKGEIVDVVGRGMCDVSMDESNELIRGVGQEHLETALPRRGGPVLVLYGRHKGVYGTLVERNTENETGVVRDADTHELLNVHLEQIAEFIGDPSYIGY